ncbi:hypothetical protein C8D92_101396 [Tamilnaduibacter salinus]|uniref:Lipoprotein n=1 Tax=Tamilnaduibacter salinus TaxID=1484056 RepID=A0A2A2I4G2_9GAMM|nr:hypothetical protein [Tamilnaduibacter salinus]PAV26482.1 hypothetical protein CF392_05485 [Tamilnaduibacter salinus]PVY79187.1 hypothetical protein C8D92_101396 [Tamilnaduibacter salinus]
MIRSYRAGIVGLALTTLAGCSITQQVSMGVEDPCGTLKTVVADYGNGFAEFRRSATNYRMMTVYQAREEIVDGHCEIWSWGRDDAAYVCSVTAPSQPVAMTRYQVAVDYVSDCLGEGWRRTASTRGPDGDDTSVVTRFRPEGKTEPVLSVHNVRDQGGPWSWHTNYVYVGAPDRMKALNGR